MSERHIIAMLAVASVALCLATASAQGQSPAASKPNPPPQICVNSQCVTTSSTPPVTSIPGKGSIKWNPGHYMASDTVIYAGRTIAHVQSEMDDLNNQDAIVGYRAYVSWGALEPTQGNYDFSVLDAILTRLKTAYNKPKRLVVYLWLYGQGHLRQNDGSVIPLYIQQNPVYGASPVAGSYGWWGQNANGASTGMYAPSLYYQPVMDRLIALVQAMGQHYDGEPYFEAVDFQENATIAQAASGYGPNALYSDGAWLAQLKRLLTASTAAFPHTSIVMDNSWFDQPASGVALQQWMAANRIAAGTADSWGQSAITTYGTAALSDGIQTLFGVSQYGGAVDLRPKMARMMAVEGTELEGPYFRKYGGPWTPLDLVNGLNQTYQASHVFWTHLFGNELFPAPVPPAAKWSNLAATLSANPLTHTEYPADYP
jgi:hypothetical protein